MKGTLVCMADTTGQLFGHRRDVWQPLSGPEEVKHSSISILVSGGGKL